MQCSVVASLHYREIDYHHGHGHLNRQSNYEQFIEQYDFTNISYPATANAIERFMKQNKDVAINALLYIPPKKLSPPVSFQSTTLLTAKLAIAKWLRS